MRLCRTPALGGRRIHCQTCGLNHYVYHSCGSARCSICSGKKRGKWLEKTMEQMYNVPYVHLVTTLPKELRKLARSNQKVIYNIILRSTAKTIKEVGNNPLYIGAMPGLISILHTFGADMKYHVHVHSLVTFGGLSPNGEWVYPKHKKKLCRNRKLAWYYKKHFLKELNESFQQGAIKYHLDYDQTVSEVKDKNWNLSVSHPTMQTARIELYLAKYINRIAVSNSRLTYLKEQDQVRLVFNDYYNQKEGQPAPKIYKDINPLSFIHQYLQHVLPPYFQKTRRYGIHSSATRKKMADTVTKGVLRNGATIRKLMEVITALMKIRPLECSHCQSTDLTITNISPDRKWILPYITISNKSPPNKNRPLWKV